MVHLILLFIGSSSRSSIFFFFIVCSSVFVSLYVVFYLFDLYRIPDAE